MDTCKHFSLALFACGVSRYVVTTSLNNCPQTWAASHWPVNTEAHRCRCRNVVGGSLQTLCTRWPCRAWNPDRRKYLAWIYILEMGYWPFGLAGRKGRETFGWWNLKNLKRVVISCHDNSLSVDTSAAWLWFQQQSLQMWINLLWNSSPLLYNIRSKVNMSTVQHWYFTVLSVLNCNLKHWT